MPSNDRSFSVMPPSSGPPRPSRSRRSWRPRQRPRIARHQSRAAREAAALPGSTGQNHHARPAYRKTWPIRARWRHVSQKPTYVLDGNIEGADSRLGREGRRRAKPPGRGHAGRLHLSAELASRSLPSLRPATSKLRLPFGTSARSGMVGTVPRASGFGFTPGGHANRSDKKSARSRPRTIVEV